MDKNIETWKILLNQLSEGQQRWLIAQKALEIGRGGITQMSSLTGFSRTTIIKGIKELRTKNFFKDKEKIRNSGGGRRKVEHNDPEILLKLNKIMDNSTAGSPMDSIRWTNKTCRKIADELKNIGHHVTHETVCRLLKEQGYTLQSNFRQKEGNNHPDRDAQFKIINQKVDALRLSQNNVNP